MFLENDKVIKQVQNTEYGRLSWHLEQLLFDI